MINLTTSFRGSAKNIKPRVLAYGSLLWLARISLLVWVLKVVSFNDPFYALVLLAMVIVPASLLLTMSPPELEEKVLPTIAAVP